jgi:sugar/nucleoside kinase (ribokinase family)
LAAVTRSGDGACVVSAAGIEIVPVPEVERIIDTTGAGDLFAAGFLYGLTHGYDLGTAARIGSLAAGEVISHLGARPATSLAELAAPLLDR